MTRREASAASRQRADEELVARGLVATLAEARARILAGEVWRAGERVTTAGARVVAGDVLEVRPSGRRFVSRGGEKLDGALAALGVAVEGRRCLDVGASTGGFTDCLLRRGAATVTALDVGKGQLDAKLRADPRVRLALGRNARLLGAGELEGPYDLVVVDVSFTSAAPIVRAMAPHLATPLGDMLVLVKPQFEAPRSEVGPGGIVRDPAVADRAVERVASAAAEVALRERARLPSPLKGARGNQEHFLHLGW